MSAFDDDEEDRVRAEIFRAERRLAYAEELSDRYGEDLGGQDELLRCIQSQVDSLDDKLDFVEDEEAEVVEEARQRRRDDEIRAAREAEARAAEERRERARALREQREREARERARREERARRLAEERRRVAAEMKRIIAEERGLHPGRSRASLKEQMQARAILARRRLVETVFVGGVVVPAFFKDDDKVVKQPRRSIDVSVLGERRPSASRGVSLGL